MREQTKRVRDFLTQAPNSTAEDFAKWQRDQRGAAWPDSPVLQQAAFIAALKAIARAREELRPLGIAIIGSRAGERWAKMRYSAVQIRTETGA